MSNVANASGAAGAGPPPQDSVNAVFAGWLGAALVVLGLFAFVGTTAITSSAAPSSLGFGAISGVALLSVTLVGLIILTRSVGLADATQALGLPNGTVRALLALILAIVFVAVASWTLGGMFDPLGPLVYSTIHPEDKPVTIDQKFLTDQYIVVETSDNGKTATKVYLKRAAEKDLIDIAKQIVTISATVLVTVVGFYFGSKSASDAVKSAGDNLATMKKALSGDDEDSAPTDDETSATADGLQKKANAISAFTASAAAKLKEIGDSPMDQLQKDVGDDDPDGSLKASIASAEAALKTMNDKAKVCSDDASKAAQLKAAVDGADQKKLDDLDNQLQSLLNDATQANHDFEGAYSTFVEARESISKAATKG